MRNQFVELLRDWAVQDSSVRLIVGDLGYGVVESFEEAIPKQFINAGIAEQSMMTMAAGMASEGLRPFVYSIANFPTFRAAEQIRNDVAHHGLPVTVVSVGGGLVYGSLGYSHHAIQDYALMRSMPEMTIFSPGDPIEMTACVEYLKSNSIPAYLRIGNPATGTVRNVGIEIVPGMPQPVGAEGSGSAKMLLTTGAVLELASGWIESGRFRGYELHTLPAWGSQNRSEFVEAVRGYTQITTVEDHLLDGGFGSWALECFAGHPDGPAIDVISLDPRVSESVGKEAYLRKLGGLLPNR